MDKSASMKIYKRRKMVEGQGSNDKNEDRISNIPEHILYDILSFLPTKDVVGTSVLSTRWKDHWKSVHSLDFSDTFHSGTTTKPFLERKKIFTYSVNRVLLLNEVSNIHSFKLECDANTFDAAQFKKWMSAVQKRKVQELVVFIRSLMDLNCVFPLFCPSQSLKILKCEMKASIELPTFNCFSSLQVLHLTNIAFFSTNNPIQDVFLKFPILVELVMENSKWSGMNTVNISAPIVKVLNITDFCIRNPVDDFEIKIHSEIIESLKLRCLFFTYCLYNLSSVVKAEIELCSSTPMHGKDSHRLLTLLRGISNVKDLNISANIIQAFFHPDISSDLIQFSDLTHLGLKSCNEKINNSVSGRHFVALLQNMPNIESLYFPWGLRSFRFKGQGRMLGTTPNYFLSALKIVNIGEYSGNHSDMWFLKFLVKSANVMDKLTMKVGYDISTNHSSNEAKKEKVRQQLETLARELNCWTEFTPQDYIKVPPS